MQRLTVPTSRGLTYIEFGGLLVSESATDFFLVDQQLGSLFKFSADRTIFFNASEEKKTLESVSNLSDSFAELGLNRESRLWVVGGGILQDLGTMLASLYMRGIHWIYVPTTTNSMLDSCVGGKSAINTSLQKNLIGNFYPPDQVLLDLTFLETLPKIHYFGGLFEALKIVFAARPDRLSELLANLKRSDYTVSQAEVELSLESKISVVSKDEFDRGDRILLNYGHTFGHALEYASRFSIPHGVAVGIGMLAANALSKQEVSNIDDLEAGIIALLQRSCKYSSFEVGQIDWDNFEIAISQDKKHSANEFNFVVPDSKGSLALVPYKRQSLSTETLVEIAKLALEKGWQCQPR